MKLSPIAAAAAFAAAVAVTFPAMAQDKDALYVKSLAATCAACHGTNGRVVDGSSVTPLAGLPRDYLLDQLKAFKAGTKPSTIMQQLARGYNDAQIEQLAAYFAAQKK